VSAEFHVSFRIQLANRQNPQSEIPNPKSIPAPVKEAILEKTWRFLLRKLTPNFFRRTNHDPKDVPCDDLRE
jgi:hypothetical protein